MRYWLACALVGAACSAPEPARVIRAPAPAAAPAAAPAGPFAAIDLDFERGGQGWTMRTPGYISALDRTVRRGGAASYRIESGATGTFGALRTELPAASLRGKRVRLSGHVRTEKVIGRAGLWLRADGSQGLLAFDDSSEDDPEPTSDWKKLAVEIQVPDGAQTVVFGGILFGQGKVWLDDLSVEVETSRRGGGAGVNGRGRDASGRPVASAVVAAVAEGAVRAAAVATSGPDGRFALTVPSGRYALTATAAGHVAGYRPVEAWERAAEVSIALGGDGHTLSGRVKTDGPLPPDLRLVALRYSDVQGDIFYVPVDRAGRFAVELPPATYELGVSDPGLLANLAGTDLTRDREVEVEVSRLEPAPDDVVTWIRDQAVALAGVEAGAGFADMKPLARSIGRTRVVALGEATHGTREFFQMKHRMLEYLVAEHGFTIFAIEANWPESLAVNDYVLTGKGDAREALEGLDLWIWRTEEVLALIEWMRAWNRDPSHRRKVKFLGFDMRTANVATRAVLAYLERVDPDEGRRAGPALAPLAEAEEEGRYAQLPAAKRAVVRDTIRALRARFASRRADWIARTSADEWAIAEQHARVVEQAEQLHSAPGAARIPIRDRAMAENVRWILDREGRRTRAMLWAHNSHVSGDWPFMGSHLRGALGRDYMSIAFLFNRGSFQAIDAAATGGMLREFTLGAAPVEMVETAFARAGAPLLFVDLRRARGAVKAWLEASHPSRQTGSLFASEEAMTRHQQLGILHDAVVYIDSTTRARPLRSAP